MAKSKKINYTEGSIALAFQLNRIGKTETAEMQEWFDTPPAHLSASEQVLFNDILLFAKDNIVGWNEEALKMNFISPILYLGHIRPKRPYNTFYEKSLAAEVNGIQLNVKADFMIATGFLDAFQKPYFHFQEYKPSKNPSGDSMGQLLEAMLIAQEMNQDGKPLYGVEIVGKMWTFITFTQRTYCVSKSFDSTDNDDLLMIIALLRHFIWILENKILV